MGKNFDSASSREIPIAVWVRSLVPNEKKSACRAIRSAMKHARGSSIIVPTVKSCCSLSPYSPATLSTSSRISSISCSYATIGIMISRCGGSATAFAARMIACSCIS